MESDDGSFGGEETHSIVSICDAYHDLDRQRADAERRMMQLPEHDEAREEAWHEVEALITQLTDVVSQLTAVPSTTPAELRAKATVLRQLLKPAVADPTTIDSGSLALALAVSTEICNVL